ncbi:MAG: type 11 methyltransferase [Anaerolineaceae bacterium]|nr:MAG: type 11 methyltransferase [Anaerolineaceae bacterium]
MSETVTHCPLCHSDRSRPFDRRDFRGQAVVNRLCRNCGLVYQSPRMTGAESAEFYAAEYRKMYQGGEGPNVKDLAVQRARANSLYEFTRRHVGRVTRHLDIGCSSGLLLQKFRETFGSQPAGIEPGEAYREYARASGIPVHASLDELKGEAPFDLVSMAHVLEHLPDPVGYLANLREKFLAPEGWLLLEAPNLYCHDSFEVAHLFSFSARTLRQTLEKAGFQVAALESHGRPRSTILPYYLTALARPAQPQREFVLRPERGAAIKRRLGLLRRRVLSRLFPKKAWIELT